MGVGAEILTFAWYGEGTGGACRLLPSSLPARPCSAPLVAVVPKVAPALACSRLEVPQHGS